VVEGPNIVEMEEAGLTEAEEAAVEGEAVGEAEVAHDGLHMKLLIPRFRHQCTLRSLQ
jgi:hypothetical protein